jgi:lipopolysaccharide biosynthesis glycosyltransferase
MRICVVLITDFNYLLYTLVAATQARKFAPAHVDVKIFLDAGPDKAEAAARAAALTGIPIALAPQRLVDEIADLPEHQSIVKQTHLSRSALLRLKLGDLVGDDYDRVLYLDGDVQIRGDLSELFAIAVPAGRFLAVRDWKAHQTMDGMREVSEERRKLSALGLPQEKWSRYFNTGVMLADVSTWRQIGPLALAYYRSHPENCQTYDQCALNAVASDRVLLISPRWNFLRMLMPLPVFREINPAIVHFAAPPKPWVGPLPPWGREFFQPYVDMQERLKDLNLPWHRSTWWGKLKWSIKARLDLEFAEAGYRENMQTLVRQHAINGDGVSSA